MKGDYRYFKLYNGIYFRLDNRTHNFQVLNNEELWEDDNQFRNIFKNQNNYIEIIDKSIIDILNKFPNKINPMSSITQEEFDKMNDIEKLKYMSQISKRTNYILDNASLGKKVN